MASTDDSEAGPDRQDGGAPDPAMLAELSNLTTVATAEHAVRMARFDDLIEQQLAAHRRVIQAHDLVAAAKKAGNPDQVDTARTQLRERIAEARAAAKSAIDEIEHMVDTHVSQYREVGLTIRQLQATQHRPDDEAGEHGGEASG